MVKAKTIKTVTKKSRSAATVRKSKSRVDIRGVKDGIMVPFFDVKGTQKETQFPKLTDAKVNKHLIAQVVRVHELRTRQGTQATKTRGEVAGSTRKIYRQKGTGRARHGSIKAPIFVGGGVTFGPHPREFRATLPQKMRRYALLQLINEKVVGHAAGILGGLSEASGKTKEMQAILKRMGVLGKKIVLVIDPTMKKAMYGARNIEGICIRPVVTLSATDVLKSDYLIFAAEVIDQIQKLQTTHKS